MARTGEAQDLLERHLAGDASARDGWIGLAQGRFVALARAMARRHPHGRRREETDDRLPSALARLNRGLARVRVIIDPRTSGGAIVVPRARRRG
jgi:hypothetical protein